MPARTRYPYFFLDKVSDSGEWLYMQLLQHKPWETNIVTFTPTTYISTLEKSKSQYFKNTPKSKIYRNAERKIHAGYEQLREEVILRINTGTYIFNPDYLYITLADETKFAADWGKYLNFYRTGKMDY